MKKLRFPAELAYVAGILLLTFGTALMEKGDLGLSMVVAPAYLLHLKLAPINSFFTFGAAEYLLQAFLLVLTVLAVRRFKLYYLFSFVTAVIYGLVLDAMLAVTALLPLGGMPGRVFYFAAGMLIGSLGVAFFFHTYLAPEVYELLVKEIAEKWKLPLGRVKTVYDCVSCAVAIIMSMAFFGWGHFEGIKAGTILCALINGSIIGWCSGLMDRHLDFADALPLRRYFS